VDNNNETLRSFGQKNLVFSGGFAMNLKNLAGQLRDKKYEIDFIEAFAKGIVDSVEKFK
jgi:hypothetical protein